MLNGQPSSIGYSASDDASIGLQRGAEDDIRLRRMQLAKDVDACMAGELFPLIDQALQARFAVEVYMAIGMQSGISTRVNLMRHAVDRVAVEWLEGARYYLEPATAKADAEEDAAEAPGEEEDDPAFAAFIERVQMDAIMKRVTRLWWVHYAVLAWPCVLAGMDTDDPRSFVVRLLTPATFDLELQPGNPGAYVAINIFETVLKDPYPQKKTRWTDKTVEFFHRRIEGDRWVVAKDAIENIYGKIPGELFRPDPFKCMADNYGKQLLEATVDVNVAKSLASNMMGAQVKVLVMDAKAVPSKQTLRQAAIIDAGGQPISMVDLQTNVEAYNKAFVASEFEQVAMQLNLSAEDFEPAATPPSGEALKMRMAARDRAALDRQPYAVIGCKSLFWKILRVLDVEQRRIDQPPIEGWPRGSLPPYKSDAPPDAQPYKLCIDVHPISYPALALELMARDDRALTLGLSNRAELYISDHPETDFNAALDKIRDNLALEKELAAITAPTPAVVPPPKGAQGLVDALTATEAGEAPEDAAAEGAKPPTTSTPKAPVPVAAHIRGKPGVGK